MLRADACINDVTWGWFLDRTRLVIWSRHDQIHQYLKYFKVLYLIHQQPITIWMTCKLDVKFLSWQVWNFEPPHRLCQVSVPCECSTRIKQWPVCLLELPTRPLNNAIQHQMCRSSSYFWHTPWPCCIIDKCYIKYLYTLYVMHILINIRAASGWVALKNIKQGPISLTILPSQFKCDGNFILLSSKY